MPLQVTTNGGFNAVESPDAQSLYFNRPTWSGKIWKRSLTTGEESFVLEHDACWGDWHMREEGLYYVNRGAESMYTVKRLDLATGDVTRVAEIERDPTCSSPTLHISPDGRWIAFVRLDRDAHDLMMIEGFRRSAPVSTPP